MPKFDPYLTLDQSHSLPSETYTDLTVYRKECTQIFHNSWQYAARSDQLRSAGDFITTEIAGEPILIVRNKAGKLQAMSNVCRHRAARVETRSAGSANRFRCRYHGWSYNLNGQLAGAPDFELNPSFDKANCRLPEFKVEEVSSFIFVHLGSPNMTAKQQYAPMLDELKKDSNRDLQFYQRKTWEVACNWKVFVDNYQDGGYHINTVHPELASVVNMNEYKTELYPEGSLQLSPLTKSNLSSDSNMLNDVRSGSHAFYWWFFPNMMVNLYQGVMDTNLVLPLSVDRCLVVFDFYFSDFSNQAALEQSLKIAEKVQDEDIEICEEVQRGLDSSFYESGPYSVRREAGGHLFHKLVANRLQLHEQNDIKN